MVMQSGRERYFAGNVPDEAGEFSGDCCQNTRLRLSSTRKVAIAFAESCLRFPAYLSDLLRQVCTASQKGMLFTRRVTIRPTCFDHHGSSQSIAGFGDRTTPCGAAAGMFAWHQAQPRHQLTRIRKAPDLQPGAGSWPVRQQHNRTHVSSKGDAAHTGRPNRFGASLTLEVKRKDIEAKVIKETCGTSCPRIRIK